MDWELDFAQIAIGHIDRDLVLSKDNLENEVDDSRADLILKWLVAREVQVTILEVLLLLNHLIPGHSHDLSLEVTNKSAIIDPGSVIIVHLVVNLNASREVNLIIGQ